MGMAVLNQTPLRLEAKVAIEGASLLRMLLCYGDNDGAFTVMATGGSGIFQYSGDGANFIQNNEFGGLTADLYVVCAGGRIWV